MSLDSMTAGQADDQWQSIDDVSVISRTGTQLTARYCSAVPMKQRRVKMMTSYLTPRSGTSS